LAEVDVPESVNDLELWSRNLHMIAGNRPHLLDDHSVREDTDAERCDNSNNEDESSLPLGLEVR
jgi:hypothetical protein